MGKGIIRIIGVTIELTPILVLKEKANSVIKWEFHPDAKDVCGES